MALRAGYYGLKNSVKRTLEKLASDMAGAKIIKTVGDGLFLSDQGALVANIDSETMEFKDHKLAAKVPTIDPFEYSTTEFNAGKKWIDGKDVYGIVFEPTDVAITANTWVNLGTAGIGTATVETLVNFFGIIADSSNNETYPLPDEGIRMTYKKSTDTVHMKSDNAFDHTPKWIYLEYTKVTTEQANNTRKKKS